MALIASTHLLPRLDLVRREPEVLKAVQLNTDLWQISDPYLTSADRCMTEADMNRMYRPAAELKDHTAGIPCATCIAEGFKRGFEAALREMGKPTVACGEKFMKLDVTFTCKLAKGHIGKHAPVHAPAIDVVAMGEPDFFRGLEVVCDICDQPIYKAGFLGEAAIDLWMHTQDGKSQCYGPAHPLFDPLCLARPRSDKDERQCANCRLIIHRIGEQRERRWFHVGSGNDRCRRGFRVMAVPMREDK